MLYWYGNKTLSALGKPTRISRSNPTPKYILRIYKLPTYLPADWIAALIVVSI